MVSFQPGHTSSLGREQVCAAGPGEPHLPSFSQSRLEGGAGRAGQKVPLFGMEPWHIRDEWSIEKHTSGDKIIFHPFITEPFVCWRVPAASSASSIRARRAQDVGNSPRRHTPYITALAPFSIDPHDGACSVVPLGLKRSLCCL